MRLHWLAALSAGLVYAGSAHAQTAKPSEGHAQEGAPAAQEGQAGANPRASTEFEKRLEEVDARAAKIEDLSAEFEQQKKTPLLKKALSSSGTVLVKGSRTRWDTTAPHPTVMTIDPKALKIYYPDQKTVEVYPIDAGMARLAASPLPRLSTIREQFTVTQVGARELDPQAREDELGLKLVPIRESLREHVTQVRVLLDPATAIGRRVEITDADGEVTVLEFKNVKVNTGLKEEQLELKTPKGTMVSRPLQGEGPREDREEQPGRGVEPKEKK